MNDYLYAAGLLRDHIERGRTARDLALKGANLCGCDLARLRADGLDLEDADLREASLVEVNWEGCVLRDARLDNADFTGAVLRDCDLDHARATGVVFARASLENSKARGARFDDANFSGSTLDDTDFSRASLRGANLEGASATGADFRGADLHGARLRDAKIVDADMRGADLTGADLTNADLRGAILEGVLFEGATFTGARFDEGIAAPVAPAPEEPPPAPLEDTMFAAVDALGGLLRAAMTDPRLRALAEILTAEPERAPTPGVARRVVDALRRELAARGLDLGKTLEPLEQALTSLEGVSGNEPPEAWKPILERMMKDPPSSLAEFLAILGAPLTTGEPRRDPHDGSTFRDDPGRAPCSNT